MPKVQEGTFMNQLRDENEEIQKLKRQILAKERIIENQREQIKHLFMNKETAHLDYINENQEDNYRKQYEYIISYYKEFNNEFNSLKNIRLYLNSLLRNVEDIIYRLDPQGCICYVNDKVLQYGYEKDELMGMNILELIHPDDRDSVKYNVRERRTGERRTKSVELRFLTREQRLRLARTGKLNGEEYRHCTLSAEGIYRNDLPSGQNFLGTNGVLKDVTTHKATEWKLNKLHSVIQRVDESVIITDPEGNVEYVNPAFEKNSGYKLDEVKGQKCSFLKSGMHTQSFYDELWRTLRSGREWSGSFINQRKDGSRYSEATTIFPIYDQKSRIINYIAVKRDHSNEAELQAHLRQAQKMEAVGQLAGGIAHDFNNILTVINGYAELMQKKIDKKDPYYEYASQIFDGGQRAKELIQQLLAFSRKEIINTKVFSLNDLITELNKMLRRLIGEHIQLKTVLKDNLPPIEADPGQIQQILVNLVVNARDAINQEKDKGDHRIITIETDMVELDLKYVEHHAGSHTGRHVVFAVSDTGIGMSEEVREKIFEPFFTTKEVNRGTGLGLSTVYGIVKQNNGCIYVYSEPGMGSTFKIYWPASIRQDTEQLDTSKNEEIQGGTESVLIVEDDDTVRRFTVSSLSDLGYKVFEASDGTTAIRMIRQGELKIDLLITDAVMPRMSGQQLAEKIIELFPGIKVLYTSGYTDNHIIHKGHLKQGVNFIQKPYTGKGLAIKVREALDKGD